MAEAVPSPETYAKSFQKVQIIFRRILVLRILYWVLMMFRLIIYRRCS